MSWRSLRPVGNRIDSARDADPDAISEFAHGYRVIYLSSGTAALALAIATASKQKGVREPEVILPAYGCPDLVAAAVHAGVRPVLADVTPEAPQYDLAAVSALLSPNTVAIVAVTVLGIRPDFEALRATVRERGVALIEDSAQWFPRNSSQRFFGDLVVLSFGRGKPVNVLGGGALLVSDTLEAAPARIEPSGGSAWKDVAQVALYNALITPRLYSIAERIPFLGIGLTRYHPLDRIAAIPTGCKARLPTNIKRYVSRSLGVQTKWHEALTRFNNNRIIDLPAKHAVPQDYALLRYPLLLPSNAVRDRIYGRLRRAGLGASTMYAKALHEIDNVRSLITMPSDVPCARDFAGRLITLPTHDDVDDITIDHTVDIFERCLSQQQ